VSKEYYKIGSPFLNGWYIVEKSELANSVDGEMDGAPIGHITTIELVEMEEAEFQNLPEFEGW